MYEAKRSWEKPRSPFRARILWSTRPGRLVVQGASLSRKRSGVRIPSGLQTRVVIGRLRRPFPEQAA
jgi:hypothetical protein